MTRLSIALLAVVLLRPQPASADVRQAVQKLLPATVMVEWTGDEEDDEKASRQVMMSTGFVVSPDGLIVTVSGDLPASHGTYQVSFMDGRQVPATLLVDDQRSHLRLLQVGLDDAPYVELTEEAPELGQQVVTVAAIDAKDRVVAQGIVTRKDADVMTRLPVALLQTDLQVEVMSAGSALVDTTGRVVGVIVARQTRPTDWNNVLVQPAIAPNIHDDTVKLRPTYSPRNEPSSGPTFALPVRTVTALLQARDGKETVVARAAWIGVALKGDTATISEVLEDGPAERAGLQVGDVIVAVNGEKVQSPRDLQQVIAFAPVDSTVEVTYQREDEQQTAEVKLDSHPVARTGGREDFRVEIVRPARIVPLEPAPTAPRAPEAARPPRAASPPKLRSGQLQLKTLDGRQLILETPQATLETPSLHLRRLVSDEQLEKMTDEVRALRKQVEQMSRQLQELQREKRGQ